MQKRRRDSSSASEENPLVRRSARIAARVPVDYHMDDEPSEKAELKRKANQEDLNVSKRVRTAEDRKAEKRTAEEPTGEEQAKRQCLSTPPSSY